VKTANNAEKSAASENAGSSGWIKAVPQSDRGYVACLFLVDLVDGGAAVVAGTSATKAAGHAAAGGTTSSAVELLHDGHGDLLELLLLVVKLVLLGLLVLLEPVDNVGDGLVELLAVVGLELVLELVVVEGVAEVVGVRLESVLGLDALAHALVVLAVLLGLVDHAINVVLGETALLVGDGDLVRAASGLVGGRDVHDAVGVDVKGDLDLGNTAGRGGDASELKLAEEVVVLGAGTLTLVDLDEDTGLVVGVGREHLRLLAGNGGVALDQGSHDTTGSLDTDREGDDVEEEDVLGLLAGVASEDGSLSQKYRK